MAGATLANQSGPPLRCGYSKRSWLQPEFKRDSYLDATARSELTHCNSFTRCDDSFAKIGSDASSTVISPILFSGVREKRTFA